MPPLASETPHPGDSTSTPGDDRFLAFLRRKLAGEALPTAAAAHFHDTDIYASDPATLTLGFDPAPAKKGDEGGSWFFFTHVKHKSRNDSRKSRMVGGGAGTWHSERAPRPVFDDEGSCVGHSQYFSYKRKTGKNCSERTDWYMVEFTEGQEGDHERVHGGEPMLVLCKIYRAHSSSRSSSSSSRSARKRKPTDEHVHVDQSSAPMKTKRRLFAPAPTPAAVSQEQVSSRVTMAGAQGEIAKSELEASNGNMDSTSVDPIFWAELVAALNKTNTATPLQKTSTATPSQNKISTTSPSLLISESDFLRFWPEPESPQIDGTSGYLKFSSETEELHKSIATPSSLLMFDWGTEALQKIHSTSDCLEFSPETEGLHETGSTPPSLSKSEPDVSALQGETTTFAWGTEALQMVNGISDYLKFSSEAEALQKTSTSPPSPSMFKPEVLELQGETTTFNWGTKASQKIDGTSDYHKFPSETEALQNISTTPPSPSQSMFEPEADYLKFSSETEALQKTSTSPLSLSMFKPEVAELQGETRAFNWETEASQKIDGTSDYHKFPSETETLQNISTTPPSPSLSMFEPEASALQDETSRFDWCIQMPAGCTPPASAHCYGTTDPMGDGFSPRFPLWEQDAWSWTGNDNSTTAPFCRDRGWSVGRLPTYDLWGF